MIDKKSCEGSRMRNNANTKTIGTTIAFVMTRISGEVECALRVQEDVTSKPPTTESK